LNWLQTLKSALPRKSRGPEAERQSRTFLETRGYSFLAANYATRYGELDLVMKQKDTVVIVEVKYRQNTSYGLPQEAVTSAKQKKIAFAAMQFIKEHRLEKAPVRFDVIAMTNDTLEHIQNAFQPGNEGTGL
jgi:putative endonuclease